MTTTTLSKPIASGVDRDEALRRSQIGPTRVKAREGQG